VLERVIDASDAHAAGVRASLQSGVETAPVHLLASLATHPRSRTSVRSPGSEPRTRFVRSLTIIYRILFLLFAEARGLVPLWHPVFRDAYSMAALQAQAEASPQPRGLWAALQAIMRLAHAGCEAGDLRVTPFNGRLFAPDRADLVHQPRGRRRRGRSRPARAAALARVLLALTTRQGGAGGREHIVGDLGVEQLGAVWRVLDYEPDPAERPAACDRPAQGYGHVLYPSVLTDFSSPPLHPLVGDATAEKISPIAGRGDGRRVPCLSVPLPRSAYNARWCDPARRAHDVTI
jgi:hypothetical protein